MDMRARRAAPRSGQYIIIPVLIAGLSLGLTACGGGSDTPSAQPASPIVTNDQTSTATPASTEPADTTAPKVGAPAPQDNGGSDDLGDTKCADVEVNGQKIRTCTGADGTSVTTGGSSTGEGAGSGSSPGAAPSGDRLTKAQLIERGDAICAAAAKSVTAIPSPTNLTEEIHARRLTLNNARQELRDLTPPVEDQEFWATSLEDFGRMVEVAQDADDAAKDGDVSRAALGINQVAELAVSQTPRMVAYGFHDCWTG